jgi:hypothetical protein
MKNLANDFPVHPAAPTLLLGANGFIGSGIRRAFGQTRPSIPLRLAARQKIQPTAESSVAEVGLAPFDFRRTDLLAEAIRGAEAVIVATSYLGADQELSRAVNLDLVRTVIEISRESEIQRLVYVSTAAVHGRGPFRGSDLRQLGYAPTSFRSRDRATADRMVLDAGGTVVRPQLILGAGDRWVMPGMSALLRALGGMPLAGGGEGFGDPRGSFGRIGCCARPARFARSLCRGRTRTGQHCGAGQVIRGTGGPRAAGGSVGLGRSPGHRRRQAPRLQCARDAVSRFLVRCVRNFRGDRAEPGAAGVLRPGDCGLVPRAACRIAQPVPYQY